jgi:hypothetical protein
MDIPPKNQFVSLDKMEAYIEKYPEDAGKWLEFLDNNEEDTIYPYKRRIRKPEDLNQDLLNQNTSLLEEPVSITVTNFSEGCLFCKKSWISTVDVPTCTLICGHKYHTICQMYNYYHHDTVQCIVEDCDINTWDYIKQIGKRKRENNESVENILVESITKRKDFKDDLKEFKTLISDVTRNHGIVVKSLTDARKELVHKHIFSITQIQKDMNDMVGTVKNNQEMYDYKKSLNKYRRKAKNIFRKYHLSFRDLERRKKLKVGWRLRWILERHSGSFNFYKLGIRMYPGKKTWTDPLTTDIQSIHSDEIQSIHSDEIQGESDSSED